MGWAIRKPNFETFRFRMDSDFEWSEFEPPQYLLFQIMTMIEQSQLEPIVKIRINESAKMELKTELAKMVDRATLDKGENTKINFLF